MPRKKEEGKDFRGFFYAFGLELTPGYQLEGDCPFCDKENHFHADPKTGQWNCKVCEQSGNIYSFMSELSKVSKLHTSEDDYQELQANRGIKTETFKYLEVCKNFLTGDWLIPAYNLGGKLANTYRCESPKLTPKSAPTCNQQLFLGERLFNQDVLFIVEGHWDAMVLLESLAHLDERGDRLIRKGKPNWDNDTLKQIAVVGAPGATMFSKTWLKSLSGKKVILVYDNDEAGERGSNRFVKILTESQTQVSSLHRIIWNKEDPNDIRDLVKILGLNHLQIYSYLQERIQPVEVDISITEDVPLVELQECSTFYKLVEHYKKELLWSPAMEQTLATMLAVALSTKHEGGQLGLRVIGAPGTAKSTFAEAIGKHRGFIYPLSKFTGLVSGWGKVKLENEVATKVNGKNLLVKDADTMLQLPNLQEVESHLRDALGDGVIRAEYRTGKKAEINTVFTCTMCGTKALREMDNALLGSRFLDIVIFDPETKVDPILDHAINSQFSVLEKSLTGKNKNRVIEKKSIEALAPPTAGFLDQKRREMDQGLYSLYPLTDRQKLRIRAMGKYIGICRTKVQRETRGGILKYRPEPELATRLTEQLTRMAIFLALVYAKDRTIRITKQVMAVIQKIAKDTSYSFTHEAIEAIAAQGKKGLQQGALAGELRLSQSQTADILKDLQELNIIVRETRKNPMGRGRPNNYCFLSQEIFECYKLAFCK